MPQITNISPQKRNADFYNIEVDGRFLCGLGSIEVSSQGLKVGSMLTADDIARLMAESLQAKAYNLALRYLSYRPRSEYELREYLLRKDYTDEVVEGVVIRLSEAKFLDDEAFAQSWVRSRQASKPRSKRALSVELAKKRVPKDIIDSVLADVDSTDELLALSQVAAKKLKLTRYSNDKKKLTQYLMGQGYKYSDVRRVLEELATHDDEADYGSDNGKPH